MPLVSVLGQTTRKPDISFRQYDGRISITSAVAKRMDIQDGDSIDIVADDFECYLIVRQHTVKGRFKAVCHPTNKGKNHCYNFRSYSKDICAFMCRRFGTDQVMLSVGGVVIDKTHGRMLTLINRNLYGN